MSTKKQEPVVLVDVPFKPDPEVWCNVGTAASSEEEESNVQPSPPTMSLDAAIQHALERGRGDSLCAAEHRQLAKWLSELQIVRDYVRSMIYALENGRPQPCDKCDAVATKLLEWEESHAFLCDKHTKDRLASDGPAPFYNEDLFVAASFRSLTAFLERTSHQSI